jgi:protein-S-isoprenylcysteine O-methyltransferase Ste14
MNEHKDSSNAVVRPPIAWALAIVVGLVADWLYPWRVLPASLPGAWLGGGIFGAGLALAVWAILTFRRAGTRVETNRPTTAIVASGPYRFTRNPIYTGMLLGQTGLAIAYDSVWMFITLVAFYLVIRYGVVTREEAYLARKFGDAYQDYKSRVRRWL